MQSRTTHPMTRLQKYMAACGVASRRRCDEMIAAGRVRVNGAVVTAMGTQIDPDADEVTLDNVPVRPPETGLVYYMLHKPAGYLVTTRDERGRPTVFDLIGDIRERVVAVGRLDYDSEGLLLLTNDGELAHRLMHPGFRVEKEYEVVVDGRLRAEALRALRQGVEIDGRATLPAQVAVTSGGGPNSTRARITITEGRKRQVRRMFEAVGHKVRRLIRVREGALQLGHLPRGRFRRLAPGEVRALRAETGMPAGR